MLLIHICEWKKLFFFIFAPSFLFSFQNDGCVAPLSKNGTCYTSEECTSKGTYLVVPPQSWRHGIYCRKTSQLIDLHSSFLSGGSASSTCASGYGVCCVCKLCGVVADVFTSVGTMRGQGIIRVVVVVAFIDIRGWFSFRGIFSTTYLWFKSRSFYSFMQCFTYGWSVIQIVIPLDYTTTTTAAILLSTSCVKFPSIAEEQPTRTARTWRWTARPAASEAFHRGEIASTKYAKAARMSAESGLISQWVSQSVSQSSYLLV